MPKLQAKIRLFKGAGPRTSEGAMIGENMNWKGYRRN
jgi:hypothetical protein